MGALENKLKTSSFWLSLGTVNHLITVSILLFGSLISGFDFESKAMQDTLTIYTFTLFTPQVAVEMILLLALLLVSGGENTLKSTLKPLSLFITTLVLAVLLASQIV